MTVNVYHDGKICRGVPATIEKKNGKRIRLTYQHWDGDVKTEWFVKRRRDFGGVYESQESNYFFYPHRETEKFANEMRGMIGQETWNNLFGDRDGTA